MLSTRLRDLLGKRNISISEFADMCELPVETVRNIYYGKTRDPKISTLLKMANALQLSVNSLMEQNTPEDEKELLLYYRSCGRHGKSIIQLVAKYEATTARAERESLDIHKVPCLIANGNIQDGIMYDACEVVDITTSVKEAYVAVKLTTNEFVPAYCKGDIILIANRFPNNGEYVMFYRGNKAFVRQFIEEDNQYRLRCIHNTQSDIVVKRMDQIEYIGTCVDVVRT
ncbi:MAG: helix-turn-helix domain-containing protein [Lachnospiraceae bacterium]